MNDQKIDTVNKTLKIKIDKSWSSSDFSNLFDSLTILYQLFIEIDSIDKINVQIYGEVAKSNLKEDLFNINGELFKRLKYSSTFKNEEQFNPKYFFGSILLASQQTTPRPDLKVSKIQFASPGFSDFVGVGKIVEQIFELIKYYFPNKKGKVENELLSQDLISKKIQNLRALGYSEQELKKFNDIKNSCMLTINDLKFKDKITGIEIKESKE